MLKARDSRRNHKTDIFMHPTTFNGLFFWDSIVTRSPNQHSKLSFVFFIALRKYSNISFRVSFCTQYPKFHFFSFYNMFNNSIRNSQFEWRKNEIHLYGSNYKRNITDGKPSIRIISRRFLQGQISNEPFVIIFYEYSRNHLRRIAAWKLIFWS